MHLSTPWPRRLACTLAVLAGTTSTAATAAPDDFRVLTDSLAEPGEAEIEWQLALTRPSPHEDQRELVLQSLLEASWGLNEHVEISLQAPSVRLAGTWHATGLNLEVQLVSSQGEPGFYYGARIELGQAWPVRETRHWASEWRPIFGYRAGPWQAVLNAGIALPLTGPERRAIFEPSARLDRQLADGTRVGVEYFAEAGTMSRWWPSAERTEWALAVVDTQLGAAELHLGVGKGLTSVSDQWVMKFRVAYPLFE